MKKGLTELVFILDRSGSMSGLEKDTIGGFNSLLEKQKKEAGACIVTTVLFDDRYELLHDRIQIHGITSMTEREYFVRGSTALLDAMGVTINKIGNAQKHTAEAERAEKVLFVITTDGMENASREFTAEKIRTMVEHQKAIYGWEFLFLGANIDAVATAAQYGIAEDRAASYHADADGTQLNFIAVNEAVVKFRTNQKMDAHWKAPIEEDFKKRSKK